METLKLAELKALCHQHKVKIPSGSKKADIIALLKERDISNSQAGEAQNDKVGADGGESVEVKRLNYIGSKYQLIDWLEESMLAKTGYKSLSGKNVADLFAGTGIVTFHFRRQGANVFANDAELYSHTITRAFNTGVYTSNVRDLINKFNDELMDESTWNKLPDGYITRNYSPNAHCERKFFTRENAQKVDYIRSRIEENRKSLTPDEYNFLVASLLVSTDNVGNVAAVYGCYLKDFKKVALRELTIIPVHTFTNRPNSSNNTTNLDVLDESIADVEGIDIAYIDPPYNERQYSKNYFPLNQIAKTPAKLEDEAPLTGKTGIPTDCFVSPFCSKRTALGAFERLVKNLNSKWVFISYNTEGIVPREQFEEMLARYGDVSVVERIYKRFKSYKYNADKEISELLFCLHKH